MLRLNTSRARSTSNDELHADVSQAATKAAATQASNFASLLRQSQAEHRAPSTAPAPGTTRTHDRTASTSAPADGADAQARADAQAAAANPATPAGNDAPGDANAATGETTANPPGDPSGLNQTLAARKAAGVQDAAAARRQAAAVAPGAGRAPGAGTTIAGGKAVKGSAGAGAPNGASPDPALLAWQANARLEPALAAGASAAPGGSTPAPDGAAGPGQTLGGGSAAELDRAAPLPTGAAPPGEPQAAGQAAFATLLGSAAGGSRPGADGVPGTTAAVDAATMAAAAHAGTAAAHTAAAPAPTALTLSAPVNSPQFAANLGLQLSMLARNGVQHAELHLNPADMGPVSVQIVMNGTQAHVDFGADLAATRHAIEAGIPELASALRDAGFTLSGGGVSQHSGGRSDSGASSDPASVPAKRAASVDAVSSVHAAAQRLSSTGGVDLFA